MCSVELVEVHLQHGEEYLYGVEYADAKTVVRSTRLSPPRTPWQSMCSVYDLTRMANKENAPLSGTSAPPCEILVIHNVWRAPPPASWCAQDDERDDPYNNRFQIVTLWDREETDGHLFVETLELECPWLFNADCTDDAGARRLFADDSIEIRTIAPPRRVRTTPQYAPHSLSSMRACLRAWL